MTRRARVEDTANRIFIASPVHRLIQARPVAEARGYAGGTVYFCCPSCEAHYQKDPEKYLKVLDQPARPAGQPLVR